MNQFKMREFALRIRGLQEQEVICDYMVRSGDGGVKPSDALRDSVLGLIHRIEEFAHGVGFEETQSKTSLIRTHYEGGGGTGYGLMNAASFGADLRNISDVLLSEVWRYKFLLVKADRADYLDNANLLGETVPLRFKSAVPDIKEAGNCLAADCNTAAVFHLMRAVEWGLRAFGVHLGFKTLVSRTKAGKKKRTPVSHSDWEHILNELQERVDQKVARLKRGAIKQHAQEFYYPALQDIRGVRDAWRNHTMHTRRVYSPEDANAVLGHVKRLMTTLATRVSEV